MLKRSLTTAAIAMTMAFGAQAEYPDRPISLIVPYKAGGTTHTMSMVMSKALGKALGTKVIVKTKPGGGAAVGATFTANAKPDGYTIMYADLANMIWNPMTRENVKFQMADLRLIAGMAKYQFAIVALPTQPYKTLPELISHTKTNALNVADMGGFSKVFLNYVAAKENVKWTTIPTRGGGEMVPFLLGGKVDFAYSGGIHQKHGDKMLVLASLMPERLALAPDAPSFQELYGISMPGNAVLSAPAGISDEIAAKLEAAAKMAMDDPDFTKILERIQFPKAWLSSAELVKFTAEVTPGIKKVVDATR
jgi:tripartite-type tricarboxylate transporter receptor subunit TctC